jgi:hypothetical protein
VSQSLAVRGDGLLDKAPYQFAHRGSERAKVAFNVEKKHGRVV